MTLNQAKIAAIQAAVIAILNVFTLFHVITLTSDQTNGINVMIASILAIFIGNSVKNGNGNGNGKSGGTPTG